MAEHAEAVMWTDGAARGNPGPAGIGVMLKTRTGEVIATIPLTSVPSTPARRSRIWVLRP